MTLDISDCDKRGQIWAHTNGCSANMEQNSEKSDSILSLRYEYRRLGPPTSMIAKTIYHSHHRSINNIL